MNRLSFWEITGWKFKTSGKLPVIIEESLLNIPQIHKGKKKKKKKVPGWILILTNYAQK